MEYAPQDDLSRAQAAQSPWLLPAAIVFAGLVLAAATYVFRTHHLLGAAGGNISYVAPVTPADHIVGSPSAPVVLIEYGDIDSSYSKQFQSTLEELMSQYASGGQVAWVYRHFPLLDQHPNAEMHAEAAECVASIGGPSAFWTFIDTLQARAPGTSQFDPADYPSVVSTLGINQEAFSSCLTAHTFQKRVGDEFDNAMAVGADGAPYTIVLIKGVPTSSISGALPYDALKRLVDADIKKAQAAN